MKYLLDKEETQRIYFRKIELSDSNQWLNFFQTPESFEHWVCDRFDPETECENWYKKQFHRYETDRGGMNALIEKTSGKLIGHCGLLIQQVDGNIEMEIGYSLLSAYWNKGFATEAARKCRDHAFEHTLSKSLISIISLTNAPSANVALKNGMTLDRQTYYNHNAVNVFRIHINDWKK